MSSSATFSCDTALARRAAGAPSARPRLALVTSILASSLAFVDGSVVNVGLPAIGRNLHADAAQLQWAVNAYLLPLSALLLIGGALGDRLGRRRLLIFGVGLFAISSAACAAAPSLAWMLAARAVQGVGAALVLPNSLALLGGAFEGEARGRAVGLWAAASAMSSALGPVLGGWLIDISGWRAIFLINLPIAAAAIVLAVPIRDPPETSQPAPLDVAGALLAMLALGAIAWAFTVGAGPGGWTIAAIVGAVAGVGLLAAFVWVEAVRADRALTPPALFGSRRVVALNLMTFLLYGALGGFLVLLPYVLIAGAGFPATAAGAALLPFPLVMALGGPFAGALAGRIGSQGLLTMGSLVTGAGLLLALLVEPGGAYWTQVLPCVLVIALGMTCSAAPLTTAILAAVDPRNTGSASGFNSAVARTGGLFATALVGNVLTARGHGMFVQFHLAAVAGAAVAAGAAASAWLAFSGPAQGRAPLGD